MHDYFTRSLFSLIISATAAAGQERARWPQFRGPNGSAVAVGKKRLPVEFGPKKNVLWKTPLPSGHSSPIVWDDRIFLTGYSANKLETICLDRHTGKILWRRIAPAKKIERVNGENNPATATPATDGKRVYVSFGSYGLLCYNLDGKGIWRRPLPTPRPRFGTATSPIVAGNMLLLNCQGNDLHLMAFDAATGKTIWTTEGTPFPSDHPVPMLWQNENVTEVIIPGRRGLLAYNLKDGKKRWWIPGLSPEASSSPAQGDGLLFVASHMPGGDPELRFTLPDFDDLLKKHDKNKDAKIGRNEAPRDLVIFRRAGNDGTGSIRLHQMYFLFDKNRDNTIERAEWLAILKTPFNNSLLAIRPGGAGDISDSHIAWKIRRGVPEVPSPLYYRGRLYMVRNGGVLTCLDAKTGKLVYPRARLGGGRLYYSSPVAGDGKVYFASKDGVVTVLGAGGEFKMLAQNDLGEAIAATPALVDGKIYLRTARHLYAFCGEPGA